MKYTLSVDGNFSSAHALRGYKGKCENLHGHNWLVRLKVSGKKLDKLGMLVDFTILKATLKEVMLQLDHKYLNEVAPFNKINPSAENIAAYIFSQVSKKLKVCAPKTVKVEEVSVWESQNSCATVNK